MNCWPFFCLLIGTIVRLPRWTTADQLGSLGVLVTLNRSIHHGEWLARSLAGSIESDTRRWSWITCRLTIDQRNSFTGRICELATFLGPMVEINPNSLPEWNLVDNTDDARLIGNWIQVGNNF